MGLNSAFTLFTEKDTTLRASRSYDRRNLGGPFTLASSEDGKPFTDKDMLGKWSFVYFGFTNCLDICPAELDKVTGVMDRVGAFFLLQLLFSPSL
jgi:protein SCO1/2